MASETNRLVHISGGASAKKATIVVGGIHDTYKHFASWEKDLSGPNTVVLGFDHNHQSSTMADGGKQLAAAIRELKGQGIEDVQVVAHSMGGLVSKSALNELVKSGDAEGFKSIDFHALGTPWGGFALASLPGATTFGPMMGYPMAGEMAPDSQFMQDLSKTAWPDNMTFSVYQGTADNISLPSLSSTQNRYSANVAGAQAFVNIEDYKHTDYVKAGADVLMAGRGLEPANLETVSSTKAATAEAQADTATPTAATRDSQSAPESAKPSAEVKKEKAQEAEAASMDM